MNDVLKSMVAVLSASGFVSLAQAGARETAHSVYTRVAGVPPTKVQLVNAEALVAQGKIKEAAMLAMQNPEFYATTIRDWVAPWSNTTRSSDTDLNDFIATAIGMVRDNIPFDQALYGDILYVAKDTLVSADGRVAGRPLRPFLADYVSQISLGVTQNFNLHYMDLQASGFNLADPNVLVKVKQSDFTKVPVADVAGLLTTRSAAESFFQAGTNRRAFRYAMINFLCRDLEQVHDTTVSDFRVRQDVDRKPGGDSRVFRNSCVGCHAIQDGFTGAFAHYDYTIGVSYRPNAVQGKYTKNSNVFPEGYRTIDNSWVNNITGGINESLGWRGDSTTSILGGMGARSMGKVLAKTEAFSQCMAERAFKQVCLRSPFKSEASAIKAAGKAFENQNYSVRGLFAEVSDVCFHQDES